MKIREFFYGGAYFVAFRFSTDISVDGIKSREWKVIPCRPTEWFADPFPFEWNRRFFIFVERMHWWSRLGTIAVAEVDKNGNVSKFKDIVAEPFHLSFPNVFSHRGEVYMIPESGMNGDIRLYRATDFPWKWTFVKALATGANYVDTSFVQPIENDRAILNTQNWTAKESVYFKFDLNKLELSRLPDNPQMMNERNGGNVFSEKGTSYRVLQDCSKRYGAKIMIRRIDNVDFESGHASDSQYLEIINRDLKFVNRKPVKLYSCHTYNRSEHIEVVDVSTERFIWFGPIASIRNKYLWETRKHLLPK